MRTTASQSGVQMNSWIAAMVLAILASPGMAAIAADAAGSEVAIVYHQSQIMQTPWKVSRVAVTDPAIADVQVLTANQVLIQGLAVGTTDILLWSEDETQVVQKKVQVTLDMDTLKADIGQLFPTSSLMLSQSGSNLVIRGQHKNALHAQQLQEYLSKMKIPFIDMSEVVGVQQVEL
ncbi:MAG TPA: pilus assembly protein N-terminal domain-containing protein, partial [Anaerohalosphaeraceae bacterium]|nr:pilus assembly protein N-terminal domain-containing protein [Anaerohalosphaeraceae bacterium]